MTVAAVGATSIVLFVFAFRWSGLLHAGRSGLMVAGHATAVMRNDGLDDLERERAVQRAAVRLFLLFGSILARFVATLLVASVPIWLASVAGLVPAAVSIDFLARLDVILVASLVMLAALIAKRLVWT